MGELGEMGQERDAEVESYKKVLDSNRREFAKLEAALTNAQARLYRYAHWTPEHTIEEWLADRQRIVEAKQAEADAALRQQLTDAQAMIERLRHHHGGCMNETTKVGPLATMDAKVWAEEFMRLFGDKRQEIDEGLMIAWFANAIMRGYDEGVRKHRNTFDQAREALKGLSSEVAMMLGMQEEELRDLFGHANVGCLKERLDQAKNALAAMEGQP